MSELAAMPSPPSPVAQPFEYAPDSDQAERASSSLRSLSKSSPLYTLREIPAPTRIKDRCKRPSRVKRLWNRHRETQQAKKELYSGFKRNKVTDHSQGYPQLAAMINVADNFAILRRFGTTNARVLLHLQAEISSLEKELAELDKSDANNMDLQYRLYSSEYQEGWDRKQLEIMKALEEKLCVYYDLLLKDTQMRALGKPTKRNCQNVFHWMTWERPVVEGEDDWILQKDDLVPLANIDPFETALTSSFLNKLFTASIDGSITYFSQLHIAFATKLISVLLAISVLIVPVLVLFLASLSKIWMSATLLISVLTFSATLCFFTKISVQELLVGSAAYCAVLSAFLGNLSLQPA